MMSTGMQDMNGRYLNIGFSFSSYEKDRAIILVNYLNNTFDSHKFMLEGFKDFWKISASDMTEVELSDVEERAKSFIKGWYSCIKYIKDTL